MRAPEALRCCSQAANSRSSVPVSDAPVEALAAQHAQLDLDQVEPACVLGRVVKFQALQKAARFGRGECVVQRSDGVRRQIVEHHADLFGIGVVLIAKLFHAVREVDVGATVGDFDVPPGSMHVDKCEQVGLCGAGSPDPAGARSLRRLWPLLSRLRSRGRPASLARDGLGNMYDLGRGRGAVRELP